MSEAGIDHADAQNEIVDSLAARAGLGSRSEWSKACGAVICAGRLCISGLSLHIFRNTS